MESIVIARPVRPSAKSTSRRNNRSGKHVAECSAESVANGFLSHSFQPLCAKAVVEVDEQSVVERDFFESLSNICSTYKISIDESLKSAPYPANIANCFKELRAKLSKVDPAVCPVIIEDEYRSATLVTYKTYDTGLTLFYVPVKQLWEISKDKSRKNTADLLCSVFAYLNQVVGIPFHTDRSSFVNYAYTSSEEYYNDEDENKELDPGYIQEFRAQMKACMEYGQQVYSMVKTPTHLKAFGSRLKTYVATSEAETSLQQAAIKIHDLYKTYPKRSIHDSLHDDIYEHEEDSHLMGFSSYLSFIWQEDDMLIDFVIETVNNETQDVYHMQEPVALQYFDTPQTSSEHDLTFEQTLFQLILDLIDSLLALTKELK